MLIRKQGRQVKLVRVESSKGSAARDRSCQSGRGTRRLVGSFRVDEPVPPALIQALKRDERSALACWLAVYQEEQARARALPVLAKAPEHFEAVIAALEAAADTLSVDDADQLWAQLQAIARMLKRAGHVRPRVARRPQTSPPGQRDFFGESDEYEQRAEQ